MSSKRALIALAFVLAVVACVSAPPQRGPMPSRGGLSDDLDLLPRANWWHEPRLNERLDLSGEQMQQLDALQKEHGEEITRLQNDLRIVMRDLRTTIDRRDANANDIRTAGDRLATLRDDLFRRRLSYLAAQRAVLTLEQWKALQQQLEEREDERMPGPRGGRGGPGPGGGGRRPPRW